MKPSFISIILLTLAFNCTQKSNIISIEDNINQLIQTDKDFSSYSVENGTGPAFIAFSDSSVIMISDGGRTVVGRDNLTNYMGTDNPPGSPVLKWEPLKAEVAASGDLGYTFGRYESITLDSLENEVIRYGTYVSVWKKQDDGSWKFVIDAGNSLPDAFQWPKKD